MTQQPDVVLRGPDALPVLAPYLCGFVPGRSLLVIGLDRDRIVRVTMRFDLPGDPDEESALVAALGGPAAAGEALAAVGADRAVVLVYPLAEDASWPAGFGRTLPHRALVAAVEVALPERGVEVLDTLCVVGERARSYGCSDPACCPPEGRLAPPEVADAVRAQFVGRETAVLPSRAALVEALRPRESGDPLREAVDRRRAGVLMRLPPGDLARVEGFLRALAAWSRAPRDQVRLVRLVLMVGALVDTVGRRDLLLHRLTAAPQRAVLGPVRQVLAEAVRCSEPGSPDLAALATTLAVCSWVDGDGAAAWVALDRAREADPAYRLGALVATALDRGLPPSAWTSMMAGITAEELLAGAPPDPERWPA